MSKIKVILIVLLIIMLMTVCVVVGVLYSGQDKTYYLGDYGITIVLPSEFGKMKANNDTHVLYVYGKESELTVSATALPKSYWSSGDLDVIMDEYIKLLSAAKYECNFKDISLNKVKIDKHEVGKVELTIEYRNKSYRTITYILGEDAGNLTIEIYGEPDIVKKNEKLIEKIGNSIKIGQNRHNYSNFAISDEAESGE